MKENKKKSIVFVDDTMKKSIKIIDNNKNNFYRYILDTLIGDKKIFSLQHRIFNATSFAGIIMNIMGAIGNYSVGLDPFSYIFPIFSSLLFAGFYLYSIIKKNFNLISKITFAYLLFVFFPVFWFFNGGSQGGFQYFSMFFLIIVITTMPDKKKLYLTLFLLTIISTLCIEYFFPEFVINYNNRTDRYIDLIISYTILYIIVITVLNIFMKLYQEANNNLISQKKELEISNKNIRDSINYASRIQNAILPNHHLFENNFSDYFIFFKPKDIVSGDFYWAKKMNEFIIFVSVDCTGHGVPGAFVSMLGASLLNEIVKKKDIKANEILNLLRERLKNSLKQKGVDSNETKDGMDLALCVINTKTKVLQFSGANNPLYLLRNNELIEFKGDRQPIGIYIKEKPFTNHIFQLKKNDNLYTFSDGYVDQFGGEKGRKFMKKRFKNLLLNIQNKGMAEQKQILDKTLENWKGNLRQIDDVIIIGVTI